MTEFENLGLDLADEDYQGLYEMAWAIRGRYPKKENQAIHDEARAALISLWQKSLISFFSTKWATNDYSEVKDPEKIRELLHLETFEAPDNLYYCFSITNAGRQVYEKQNGG